jgi:hypothetical protein
VVSLTNKPFKQRVIYDFNHNLLRVYITKINFLMLFREKNVYDENHPKPTNRSATKLLNVEEGGTYSYQRAFKVCTNTAFYALKSI